MNQKELQEIKDTWWILQKIESLIQQNPNKERVDLLVDLLDKNNQSPAPEDHFQILLNLQEKRLLKIGRPDNRQNISIGLDEYALEIIQPKFDLFYKEYRDVFKKTKTLSIDSGKIKKSEIELANEKPSILKKRLERKFDLLHSFEDGNFFRSVADYVKAVEDSPLLRNIVIKNIFSEREKDKKDFNYLANQCNLELVSTAKQLHKLLKKKGVKSKKINEAIEYYNGFKAGRNFSSKHSQNNDYSSLRGIIGALNSEGHKDIVKYFAKLHKNGLIYKYTFSQTYIAFAEEEKYLENYRPNTVWGAWEDLSLVYLVIHQRKELIRNINENSNPLDATYYLIEEMDNILNGKVSPNHPRLRFIRENYNNYVARVQDFLLTELENVSLNKKILSKKAKIEQPITKKCQDKYALEIKYDNNRILTINNTRFARPTLNGNNDLILNHVFENLGTMIKKEALENILTNKKIKPFNAFLNDIKIQGKIREYLFDVNKNTIKLKASRVFVKDTADIKKIKEELKRLKKVEKG